MGHRIGKARKPRSGSLQFWPRVRAKRRYAKVRSWPSNDETKILGFAGYKAGMTHALIVDNEPHSSTKGEKIFMPITIVECPPLKTFSVRLYKKTDYSTTIINEIFSQNVDKELARKIKLAKKTRKEKEINIDEANEMRVIFYTQPKLTGIGKKKPEVFEVAIGGKDIKEKYEFAKSLLNKEVKVSEVFKSGQFVDVHAVNTGKGLQGVVKRFGVSLKSHKSEKKRRSTGNLGSWTPKKVSWKIPQKGQMGYHTRTDYNKLIVAVGNDPKKIDMRGGFLHYGNVRNDYVILKGSIPGPANRLIRLNYTIRQKRPTQEVEISYLSLESKQ